MVKVKVEVRAYRSGEDRKGNATDHRILGVAENPHQLVGILRRPRPESEYGYLDYYVQDGALGDLDEALTILGAELTDTGPSVWVFQGEIVRI